MRLARAAWLSLTVIVLVAPPAGVAGYAWYLRSGIYREACAAALSAHVGKPSAIGRVVPRSWTTREFRDVKVWLPSRRALAAACERAVAAYVIEPEGVHIDVLALERGVVDISTATWLRSDYRDMLESGLRPVFAPRGPHRITFRDMTVRLSHDAFHATLDQASGEVEFQSPQRGRAVAQCMRFNGRESPEPVVLRGEFSPMGAGVRLDGVWIDFSRMPLGVLTGDLPGDRSIESGVFSGSLHYAEPPGARVLTARGELRDVQLEELTAAFSPTPVGGVAERVALDEFVVRDGHVERVRFSAVCSDVVLGDALAALGLTGSDARLSVRIHDAVLTAAGIERLSLSARGERVSLARLSTLVGRGAIRGVAQVVIDDLSITDNELTSLDARAEVIDDGEPRTIDRQLLISAIQHVLGAPPPPLLPATVTYSELGVRLSARDELLHVFGSHGPKQRTLLSLDIAGRSLGVLFEPHAPIDLKPHIEPLRAAFVAEWSRRWASLASDPRAAWAPLPPGFGRGLPAVAPARE